jgi:ubiquinol-cytochrome c reductase cytochrome b subunit
MFFAILVLLLLPYLDQSNTRGIQFKPLMKVSFWIFVANFLLLMKIGALHPEEPFITVGQISTFLYFAWFFIAVPSIVYTENTLFRLNESKVGK